MNLDRFLSVLAANPGQPIQMMLPDRSFVPAHFHVTEVGRVHRDFIDCGGTIRETTSCVLQVWVAEDTDHRLETSKLAAIMRLAAPLLKTTDLPVEIEYESGMVSQYPLGGIEVTPAGLLFHLGTKHTACLALDRCGLPTEGASCCGNAGCG
jgi:hypothetical protein